MRDPMDEYARSIGWTNNAERMQAIRKAAEKTKRLNSVENGQRLQQVADEIAGRKPIGPLVHAASALGVRVTEYTPTPEQLRAGRVALGLEPADEPATGATRSG